MDEIWKPVPGYELQYEASSLGRIRSTRSKTNTRCGLILKPKVSKRKYLDVTLCNNGIKKSYRVHAVIAVAFLGPRPLGGTVNHKDGNKQNNTVDNLEWCSVKDNIRHARLFLGGNYTNPPILRGEKNPKTPLKSEDVIEIRRKRREDKTTFSQLAKIYGVSKSAIRNIVNYKTWIHIN